MSLQADVRFFVKRFIKNPLLVAALTFLILRLIQKYLKREHLSEALTPIKSKGNKHIIFDTQTKMYIITDDAGDEIHASKNLKDVEVLL